MPSSLSAAPATKLTIRNITSHSKTSRAHGSLWNKPFDLREIEQHFGVQLLVYYGLSTMSRVEYKFKPQKKLGGGAVQF